MVVIPKELFLVEAKDLRPLSMSSSVSKCFCRLLMLRTSGALTHTGASQCSGAGRQTAEYLFCVGRLMQLESEWHAGFAIAKLDLHKAYDMVNRKALLTRLRTTMGDGPTFRCWHALLSETDAALQTCWNTTRLQVDRGIRQGSIESPALFSWLAEQILEDTRARFSWDQRPLVYSGLRVQELLFMDDGCIWARNANELSAKLNEWAQVLHEAGLVLNPDKCRVYFSPYMAGPREVKVQQTVVPVVDVFQIMGVPFRVGAASSELLAPFFQRARDKFWSLKHLLRANTPLMGRVQLLDRVIGGLVLWCLAALAPDKSAMILLNSLQLQLTMWCMKVGKRSNETWLAFKQRRFRGARQVVWNCLRRRWSTAWLERWWNFSGHRARGRDRVVPGAASIMDNFRDRSWWVAEQLKPQGQRLQHPRHYPKLSNLEKDMDFAAGGAQWRVVARDRAQWQACRGKWIECMDVPWTGQCCPEAGTAAPMRCATS